MDAHGQDTLVFTLVWPTIRAGLIQQRAVRTSMQSLRSLPTSIQFPLQPFVKVLARRCLLPLYRYYLKYFSFSLIEPMKPHTHFRNCVEVLFCVWPKRKRNILFQSSCSILTKMRVVRKWLLTMTCRFFRPSFSEGMNNEWRVFVKTEGKETSSWSIMKHKQLMCSVGVWSMFK